ncbi:MAG: cupin domain-containing protein [Candidatus Paceibacterota bacterium]
MKLADLITPISVKEFKKLFKERPAFEIWDTKSNIDSLFGWDDLNHILRQQRMNSTDIMVLQNSNKVSHRKISREVRRWSKTETQLDHEKLLAALRDGGSIRVSRVDEKSNTLETLASDIENILSCQVTINLYASFTSTPALSAHADTHDVLVVQIAGKKAWEIFGFGNNKLPIRHLSTDKCPKKKSWKGELKKGQLLFMPRGSWHKAKVENNTPSLHLTIGFNHVMMRNFADWLEDKLSHHSVYNKHLLGWEVEDVEDNVEEEIRDILMNKILTAGFLSQFKKDSDKEKPDRFKIDLPKL